MEEGGSQMVQTVGKVLLELEYWSKQSFCFEEREGASVFRLPFKEACLIVR